MHPIVIVILAVFVAWLAGPLLQAHDRRQNQAPPGFLSRPFLSSALLGPTAAMAIAFALALSRSHQASHALAAIAKAIFAT